MNPAPRRLLIAIVLVLIALLAGWMWGASGRASAERRLADAERSLTIARARGFLLQGRLDLDRSNFGNASTHFERARAEIAGLRSSRRRDESIESIVGMAQEAQQRAAKLDAGAGSVAEQAMAALDRLDQLPRP